MGKAIILTGGASVSSDDTTAAAEDVLSGGTYLGKDTGDEAGTGGMPDNGSVSKTLNAG